MREFKDIVNEIYNKGIFLRGRIRMNSFFIFMLSILLNFSFVNKLIANERFKTAQDLGKFLYHKGKLSFNQRMEISNSRKFLESFLLLEYGYGNSGPLADRILYQEFLRFGSFSYNIKKCDRSLNELFLKNVLPTDIQYFQMMTILPFLGDNSPEYQEGLKIFITQTLPLSSLKLENIDTILSNIPKDWNEDFIDDLNKVLTIYQLIHAVDNKDKAQAKYIYDLIMSLELKSLSSKEAISLLIEHCVDLDKFEIFSLFSPSMNTPRLEIYVRSSPKLWAKIILEGWSNDIQIKNFILSENDLFDVAKYFALPIDLIQFWFESSTDKKIFIQKLKQLDPLLHDVEPFVNDYFLKSAFQSLHLKNKILKLVEKNKMEEALSYLKIEDECFLVFFKAYLLDKDESVIKKVMTFIKQHKRKWANYSLLKAKIKDLVYFS